MVGSASEVAVRLTLALAGTEAGAEKVVGMALVVFAGATVPQPGEHGLPFCVRVQDTPLFVVSLLRLALILAVLFTTANAEVGETVTAIGGGSSVSVAELDFDASVTDVAVRVTAGFAGSVAGAEKVAGWPLGVADGETVPQAGEHGFPFCVKAQPTPELPLSLFTVAVNCAVVFKVTLPEAGATLTVMAGTVIVAD